MELKIGMVFESYNGYSYTITNITEDKIYITIDYGKDDKVFPNGKEDIMIKNNFIYAIDYCIKQGTMWPKTKAGKVLFGSN